MNTIIVISTAISALATVGICLFTLLNYRMYQEMQRNQNEQQQKFQDLFDGIVISTLLTGPTSNYQNYAELKKAFLTEYKGKTAIFSDRQGRLAEPSAR